MRVWIFQTGEPLPCDIEKVRAMRAMNLAHTLLANGHDVTIWSSKFSHQLKKHRNVGSGTLSLSRKFTVKLIDSPGYRKNLSVTRLWDHFILAVNLYRALRREKALPDVAFVGFPPIEFAFVAVNFFVSRDIQVVVDVKDQWPHIFVDRVPSFFRPMAVLVLSPYFWLTKQTLKKASGVCSISEPFLDWACSCGLRKRSSRDFVATLSPIPEKIEKEKLDEATQWWRDRGFDLESEKRTIFLFLGSLTQSFDFMPMIYAARKANELNLDWYFIICGDGEQMRILENATDSLGNVYLSGWIDRNKIAVISKACSLGLAPYVPSVDFNSSIPNKIVDYFSMGLPVLTSLHGVSGKLLCEYEAGETYDPDQRGSLFESALNILKRERTQKLKTNAINLYNAQFDGKSVYTCLVKRMERMAKSK